MTEKQLQAAVVECARLLGWRVYHTYDSRRSEAGFPDLTMVRRGRIVFAELKTAKGRTSAMQDAWLDDLDPAHGGTDGDGAEAYVWRPLDWTSGRIEAVLRGA